jgi:peroxiredoxin
MHVLQAGDSAPDFELPAVNRDGVVTLADYRTRRGVLVALFRGLHCPFCRRQIARLSATQEALAREGIDTVAIVNTPLERARQYFQYRPVRLELAADPETRTHQAFGLGKAAVLPDDADPNQVRWPQTTTIATFIEVTTMSRPELPGAPPMNIFAAMDTLNQADGFAATEVDQRVAEAHGMQGTGHFLIDAGGTIRWAFIEALDGPDKVCRFPGDEEIIAAARELGAAR